MSNIEPSPGTPGLNVEGPMKLCGSSCILQMPGSRTLAAPVGNVHWYWANTKSDTVPTGFNQEQTIKAIWQDNE